MFSILKDIRITIYNYLQTLIIHSIYHKDFQNDFSRDFNWENFKENV